MSLGVGSLPFLGFLVSGAITYSFYVWYNKVWFVKYVTKKGGLVLEDFLKLGLVAAFFIPISLFMFGWSARSSVHYMVPIVGGQSKLCVNKVCSLMCILHSCPVLAWHLLALPVHLDVSCSFLSWVCFHRHLECL